jgi:hypothetical protein
MGICVTGTNKNRIVDSSLLKLSLEETSCNPVEVMNNCQ